jgi:hypothetical protein
MTTKGPYVGPRPVVSGKLLSGFRSASQGNCSGLSVAPFCREHRLGASSIFDWRRRLAGGAALGEELHAFGHGSLPPDVDDAEPTAPNSSNARAQSPAVNDINLRITRYGRR